MLFGSDRCMEIGEQQAACMRAVNISTHLPEVQLPPNPQPVHAPSRAESLSTSSTGAASLKMPSVLTPPPTTSAVQHASTSCGVWGSERQICSRGSPTARRLKPSVAEFTRLRLVWRAIAPSLLEVGVVWWVGGFEVFRKVSLAGHTAFVLPPASVATGSTPQTVIHSPSRGGADLCHGLVACSRQRSGALAGGRGALLSGRRSRSRAGLDHGCKAHAAQLDRCVCVCVCVCVCLCVCVCVCVWMIAQEGAGEQPYRSHRLTRPEQVHRRNPPPSPHN